MKSFWMEQVAVLLQEDVQLEVIRLFGSSLTLFCRVFLSGLEEGNKGA